MKKAAAFLLAVLLTGCAGKTTLSPREAYDAIAPKEQMLELTGEQMQALCGIDPQDVLQGQVYLCADSLRADELWLLEARDDEALRRLRQAADRRLEQKAAESRTYDPAQYAVVRGAKIVQRGKFFALLVSPEAERMAEILKG